MRPRRSIAAQCDDTHHLRSAAPIGDTPGCLLWLAYATDRGVLLTSDSCQLSEVSHLRYEPRRRGTPYAGRRRVKGPTCSSATACRTALEIPGRPRRDQMASTVARRARDPWSLSWSVSEASRGPGRGRSRIGRRCRRGLRCASESGGVRWLVQGTRDESLSVVTQQSSFWELK